MNTISTYRKYCPLFFIFLTLLLSGCAQSRQDLIEQAQLTGDWTLFDKRMAAMDRHEARNQQFCPSGTKLWCFKRLRHEECSCVRDAKGREMFERLGF